MIRKLIIAFFLVTSCVSQANASPIALEVMKALSADDMQGRKAGTEGGRRAGDYIIERVKSLGLDTDMHTFLTSNGGEGRNLIVKVRGTAEANGPVLVVTAHYDHTGIRNHAIHNGADDNASGVGALFSMLESFQIEAPKHDIWIIFFDEEEGGINGSNWFVQQTPELMSRRLVNVNFDMIGRSKEGVVFVTGGLLYPTLGKVVKSVPTNNKLQISFEGDGPEYGGLKNWRTSSDHKHFDARGVPFLFIHTGVHADYHRPSDDAVKINTEDYSAIVIWSVELVKNLDAKLSSLARMPS